jgi:beta-galactosidase
LLLVPYALPLKPLVLPIFTITIIRYVCDEANVETDGMKPMGRLANDWGWEAAFVSRATRMVQRDYNHACIIFWSLGNESGRGRNLRKAREAVLELDTSRPICYEGGKEPRTTTS